MFCRTSKLIKNKFKLITINRYYSEQLAKKVVVSAIQPTGAVHLGNYFGAIKLWLHLQDNAAYDCVFSIADLHSITLRHEPITLKNNTVCLAATLLAIGIDPDKCILFQQSKVLHHTQLSWILFSLLNYGRLSHLPQYKEKSLGRREVPLSLLLYPVLQTSDIILYKANEVPVGDDQLPHLTVACDLVEKFNRIYGFTFPRPEAMLPDEKFACRVKSLRDPIKKMSKSEPTPKGRIDITDPPEVIKTRIIKAITDFQPGITYEPNTRPGVSNLISIHKLVTGLSEDQILDQIGSLSFVQYKTMLADIVIEYFKPTRLKYLQLIKDPKYICDMLEKGREKANVIAESTMAEVNKRIGLNF